MLWSYYTRTYSDCRSCRALSVLRHVKHFKAVCSVKTETKANLSMTHWLNYWHWCNHDCNRRVADGIDALLLNVTHTTVYANIGIACDGPKIRMCAMFDNTAMTTDLMVI